MAGTAGNVRVVTEEGGQARIESPLREEAQEQPTRKQKSEESNCKGVWGEVLMRK